jgi:hypothetical protein
LWKFDIPKLSAEENERFLMHPLNHNFHAWKKCLKRRKVSWIDFWIANVNSSYTSVDLMLFLNCRRQQHSIISWSETHFRVDNKLEIVGSDFIMEVRATSVRWWSLWDRSSPLAFRRATRCQDPPHDRGREEIWQIDHRPEIHIFSANVSVSDSLEQWISVGLSTSVV